MDKSELQKRTKEFAVKIIQFTNNLPNNQTSWILAKQLIKSGTSIGANYREACRARSKTEFIVKIGIVEAEADETIYWLEIINDCKLGVKGNIEYLLKEAKELTAIFTSAGKTSRNNS